MTDPHVLAAHTFYIPPGMIVGHMSVLATEPHPIAFVNLFGDGAWAPGYYLLGGVADAMQMPLAGPFEYDLAARSRLARIGTNDSMLAYFDPMASIYDPNVILKPHRLVMQAHARVDSFCKIEGGDGVYLGSHVHVASFCHLNIGGGRLIMHDGSSAGSGARILSGSAMLGHASCSATHPGAVNVKTTTVIGKGATVFAGATVSPGCTLGEGSALAGGAFLRPHTTIPAGELWAGVPAVFKRKIEASR